MFGYILRRVLLLVPVLLGLSMLVFAIARLLPGDPVTLAAGPNATAADVASVAREFGLDQPLPMQYWRYLTGIVQGDWGVSIFTRRPVLEDLGAYLPATLELVLAAMVLAIGLGIPLGLMAAVFRNRWPDFLSRTVSLGAISCSS
jgi:peptide/nickel transport system permease protein